MIDRLVQLIGIFFFGVAVLLIAKEVERVGLDHVIHLLEETPFWILGLTLGIICLDYLVLSGYDLLGFRYIQRYLPYKTVLKTACTAFGISNTTGHTYMVGGSVRYFLYGQNGLKKGDLLTLMSFETVTILIGMGLVYILALGLELFVGILDQYPSLHILYGGGVLVVFSLIAYCYFVVYKTRSIRIKGYRLVSPSVSMTCSQIGISLLDNLLVFCVFYSIFRFYVDASIGEMFIVFFVAQILGLMTQVPGGLGVFESIVLYLYPHTLQEKGGILAALLIFRILYFFVPFLLAGLYLGSIKISSWIQRE